MPSSSSYVFDTIAITTLRSGLFFSCRRFVHSGLQQQLQHATAASRSDGDVEMDVLPPPSAAPSAPSHKIALDSSLHSVASRTLFSICFSESCILFVMLMCQALDIFTPSSRAFNWRISLFILLSSILVVIPISMSMVSTSAFRTSSGASWVPSFSRSLTVGLPLIAYFVLLSYVPLPAALANAEGPFIFSSALPRLTVLGVGLLGSLSGFGSVTTSWGYFPFLCGTRRNSPNQAQINIAEESLARVRDELNHKRAEIAALSRRGREQAEASPKTSSWVSRITPNFRGDNEISTLKTELDSLSTLEDHMASQVRWLRQQYADASFDRTWRGRVYVLLRRATGIYVIFRSFTSLVNILLPVSPRANSSSSSYPDFLTSFLTFLLSILPIDLATLSAAQERIPSILRQINLLVVGIIIWSSLRRVLRGVTRALRVTGHTRVTSLVLLVLAQIMSVYLLSTLIQLRTSFPPPIPSSSSPSDPGEITNLFATLPEYQFFGPVFDWSFLVAAGGAAVAEWLRAKTREDVE